MSSLPASWVEELFSRLTGIYGTAFTNKFANGARRKDGKDIGLENAKEVWAEELAGFFAMPKAITKALADLDPDFPPSSRKFLDLCRDAAKTIRNDASKAVAYKPTEEERAENDRRAKEVAKKAKATMGGRDPMAWIKKPGSKLAFEWANAPGKYRSNFAAVFAELEANGVTKDGHLQKIWTGREWVNA
jgi:hypothetical protein